MDLITNIRPYNKRRLQGDVLFNLFARTIMLRADVSTPMEYINGCAVFLNTLGDETVQRLCEASIRYRSGFVGAVGEENKAFNNPREILGLITPKTLLIPDPMNGTEPVLHLELDCQWEEEHGLEWIVRGDKVLYVGGFGDNDPWGDYTKKDSWNYA